LRGFFQSSGGIVNLPFGYPSLDARNDSRRKAQAAGVWPPSAKKLGMPEYRLTSQENKIVMPSSFSPLQ
jgi:hypothetical protein